MRMLAVFTLTLLPTLAFSHQNGTYEIDEDADVTVTFEYLEPCPRQEDSLRGSLRNLEFSEAATAEPYLFESGYYVEIHRDRQEFYILTDDQCVPDADDVSIPASRNTFDGYDLRKISE